PLRAGFGKIVARGTALPHQTLRMGARMGNGFARGGKRPCRGGPASLGFRFPPLAFLKVMTRHSNITQAVGNTPLIRLNKVSEATGCEIWGKAEFLNPGQSIKDRAALYIIRDAERRGALRPGGTIVEGTAGNTGI